MARLRLSMLPMWEHTRYSEYRFDRAKVLFYGLAYIGSGCGLERTFANLSL
jgi:hypothetical protein